MYFNQEHNTGNTAPLTQGTEEFSTGLRKMLDKFELAKKQEVSRPLKVNKGIVAEEAFRDWLRNFLPKKYAVTSGYIISTGFSTKDKLFHYDVIIYDVLESPILWIEETGSELGHGKTQAIPAEYVRAVIEVKSSLTAESVKEAAEHLLKLKILTSEEDDHNERYKKYFPPNFFSAIVFFEVPETIADMSKILNKFFTLFEWDNFYFGIVLKERFFKSENDTVLSRVGTIQNSILVSGEPYKSIFNSDFRETDEGQLNINYSGIHNFSGFAFNVLTLLNGTYDGRKTSSFHASAI